MSTDWSNEVAAKSFPVTVEGNFLEVIRAEDALALLERCRVETLEEAAREIETHLIHYEHAKACGCSGCFAVRLERRSAEWVRALKTQRKEGDE